MEARIDDLIEVARLVSDELDRRYKPSHPEASIKAYALPDNVRVRVVDPAFAEKNLIERQDDVWRCLIGLPARVRGEITMLLLMTPEERELSRLSLEFDDPDRVPR